MNRLIAAITCAVVASTLHAAEPKMDGPYIVNDLEAAREKARATGKPIFLVFRCEV